MTDARIPAKPTRAQLVLTVSTLRSWFQSRRCLPAARDESASSSQLADQSLRTESSMRRDENADNAPLSVNVLAGSFDRDGKPLSSQSQRGQVALPPDGSPTHTSRSPTSRAVRSRFPVRCARGRFSAGPRTTSERRLQHTGRAEVQQSRRCGNSSNGIVHVINHVLLP
jgi:hypothetical protein